MLVPDIILFCSTYEIGIIVGSNNYLRSLSDFSGYGNPGISSCGDGSEGGVIGFGDEGDIGFGDKGDIGFGDKGDIGFGDEGVGFERCRRWCCCCDVFYCFWNTTYI